MCPDSLSNGCSILSMVPSFEAAYVPIKDSCSVQDNGDTVSVRGDLLVVPFAHRFQVTPFRWNYTIYRTVVLVGLQLLVHGRFVIQDLRLHAHVRGISSRVRMPNFRYAAGVSMNSKRNTKLSYCSFVYRLLVRSCFYLEGQPP